MVPLLCIMISPMNIKVFAAPPLIPNTFDSLFSDQNEKGSRTAYNPLAGPSYPLLQESYFTDDSGNILMIVNVLGEVNRPGQVVVRENADFATILSLVGGQTKKANLKNVVVARRDPDNRGKEAFKVNLKQFFNEGDRSSFIALKPNDTIIIPEKGITLEVVSQLAGILYTGFTGYSVFHNHN
jgi:hypothetical protein